MGRGLGSQNSSEGTSHSFSFASRLPCQCTQKLSTLTASLKASNMPSADAHESIAYSEIILSILPIGYSSVREDCDLVCCYHERTPLTMLAVAHQQLTVPKPMLVGYWCFSGTGGDQDP